MDDTWNSRDLPVLEVVVRLLDDSPGDLLLGQAVVQQAGMDKGTVTSALHALSPDYVRLGRQLSEEAGIELQVIDGVTTEARRAVGQWPTGEGLVEQLAAGLNAAADQAADPEQRNRLRDVARGLGGAAKSIAIDIARQLIERQVPGAH